MESASSDDHSLLDYVPFGILAWNREPIDPLMFKLVMAPSGVVIPNQFKLGSKRQVLKGLKQTKQ